MHFMFIDAEKRFLRALPRYPFLSRISLFDAESRLFFLASGLRGYLSNAGNCSLLEEGVLGPAYREYVSNIMKHRFDLLGSNLVDCRYPSFARHSSGGGPACDRDMRSIIQDKMENLLKALGEVVGGLTDADRTLIQYIRKYEPIDWHRDLRSGYSWPPPVWYMDKVAGRVKEADIKAPGEISRFNQITPLAMSFVYRHPESPSAAYDIEILLQILDWIASNPPRLSLAWRSSLVSGIRCANWLWALSLLKGSPFLTPAIQTVLSISLLEHMYHIIHNLGRRPGRTGNHYLGRIVGLLHIAFACPGFPQTDKTIIFCLQEILNEMRDTVYEDGGNYESSTSYHRFVTEMFFHGTSLILRLEKFRVSRLKSLVKKGPFSVYGVPVTDSSFLDNKELFPEWYFEKLYKMCLLSAHIQGPIGLTPIIGDNDNGRFVKFGFLPIKLDPDYSIDEEFRDHRHLLALGGRLFNNEYFSEVGGIHTPDAFALLPRPHLSECAVRIGARLSSNSFCSVPIYASRASSIADSHSILFPDFGVAVLQNDRIWLLITCGRTGRNGLGGHGHNDILSFELYVDQRPVVVDPGCYTYTSNVELRNLFRSSFYHNTLWEQGQEQHLLVPSLKGIFELKENAHSHIDTVKPDSFVGHHSGYGSIHKRRFSLSPDRLDIEDWYAGSDSKGLLTLVFAPKIRVNPSSKSFVIECDGLVLAEITAHCGSPSVLTAHYSKKYGIMQQTTQLVIERQEFYTNITISLHALR
jgi:hypothetical protein